MITSLAFFLFLPVRIFEAAVDIDRHEPACGLPQILILAAPLMLLVTALTAVSLYYGIGHPDGFPWIAALIAAALLSATDPVAVLALFKRLDAPRRLRTIMDGESLFKDATAIVLFTLPIAIATGERADVEFFESVGAFLFIFLGGALAGVAVASLAVFVLRACNDAVAVTCCPLCGSGIAFAAGEPGRGWQFGVPGLLFNSDLLSYDRETTSRWSQLLIQAVSGPEKGERLEPLPLVHTSWQVWRDKHPETPVLSTRTGFDRDYSVEPYAAYATGSDIRFPVQGRPARYHPKERVLGVEINGAFKAYPFVEPSRHGESTFTDVVDGQPIVIPFDAQSEGAKARNQRGTCYRRRQPSGSRCMPFIRVQRCLRPRGKGKPLVSVSRLTNSSCRSRESASTNRLWAWRARH